LYIGGIEKGGAAALFYPFTSCHADLKSTSTFISFIPSFSCYKKFLVFSSWFTPSKLLAALHFLHRLRSSDPTPPKLLAALHFLHSFIFFMLKNRAAQQQTTTSKLPAALHFLHRLPAAPHLFFIFLIPSFSSC